MARPEEVLEWWLTLVQPYVPWEPPFLSPRLRGWIKSALAEARDDSLIREAFAAMPRLRGMVYAKGGFNMVELFRPREGRRRIFDVASGRYAKWLKPTVTDRETLDISDVLRGSRQPQDWLQVPLRDARGIYRKGSAFSQVYVGLVHQHAPCDLRFVRDFIRPRADARKFFKSHMRGLLDAYRDDPGRWP